MNTKQTLTLALLLFQGSFSFAQPNSSLPGTWKGTSICQIKDSPCHDEIVVYHISKGDAANAYDIAANKIVNGIEEEMGVLKYTYDPNKQTLSSIDTALNVRWVFNLKGNKLEGTLVSKNKLYRVVDLKKEN